MRALGVAVVLAGVSGGPALAVDLGGWTQPLSDNPLCRLRVIRVYQAASGQPIHVTVSNIGKYPLRFDLDVVLNNGRTGETRQIVAAHLKPFQANAAFETTTGYSTTGRSVGLRLSACALN